MVAVAPDAVLMGSTFRGRAFCFWERDLLDEVNTLSLKSIGGAMAKHETKAEEKREELKKEHKKHLGHGHHMHGKR